MFTNAVPTLTTISELVSLIAATVAPTSRASSCRAWSRADGSRKCPRATTLSTIASHFDGVREAMQISPSSSLCIAALWAATWPTPPAPMINTFRFAISLLVMPSEAGLEVLVVELADQLDRAVQATHRDRRHRQPVEP